MNETPYLTLFKSALPKDFNSSNFEIYFIKGFELSAEYLKKFEESFSKDHFPEVLKTMKPDPQGSNVAAFYLENNREIGEIYLVSNSSDLNGRQFILKKFNHIFDERIFNVLDVKRIN